jgi:hypothetical protein
MIKGIIRFGFQKIIDVNTASVWDKHVFDATWMEYRMQAANYNHQNNITLFTALVAENSKGEQLHNAVSTAAIGYIRQLQGIIPEVVNAHQKIILPFKNFKFRIIQSDMMDNKLHKIEIIFISEPLTLIDVFSNQYLIAFNDTQVQLSAGEEVETELIPAINRLSIYSFIKPAA